jgi:hypothetical protein
MHVAEQVARRAAAGFGQVRDISRFPLGLCHYVYGVQLADGRALVLRVASRDNLPLLRAAVAWDAVLKPIGVPTAQILEAHLEVTGPDDLPYLVLERLPGADLGDVYAGLTAAQRRQLAESVVEVQSRVSSMPLGRGFGYVPSPTGPFPAASWSAVVEQNLARSRKRMEQNGSSAPLHDRVGRLLRESAGYLDAVQPQGFLDDLTTKNVIVHEGRLSGVVDVDAVCFGDALYTPALAKVALIADGQEPDYVEAWLERLELRPEQTKAFDVYTAVFVLDLLSERGLHFNRPEPVVVSDDRESRLRQLFESLVP